jgi:hypothetical protein
MMVICINGSINSGKSTIARLLAEHLRDARFVEGDDHDGHELPFEQMIARAVQRLAAIITEAQETLVIAYPLRETDFAILRQAAAASRRPLLVVTLAPPLEVVLAPRGARRLDDGERARIREMYAEGYHARPFSDLVIGGEPTPDAVVAAILELTALRPGSSAPAGG